MKTFLKGLAAGLVVCLAAGCSSFLRPVPQVVAVVTTNAPAAPAVVPPPVPAAIGTNAAPAVPAAPAVVIPPVLVTNFVVVTNWTVAPAVSNTVATLQAANAAFNPTPSEPLINWGLGLIPAAVGAFAAWRNHRKVQALHGMLDTVVSAIETAPAQVPIKDHVASIAAIKGTAQALDQFVQVVAGRVEDAVPAKA